MTLCGERNLLLSRMIHIRNSHYASVGWKTHRTSPEEWAYDESTYYVVLPGGTFYNDSHTASLTRQCQRKMTASQILTALAGLKEGQDLDVKPEDIQKLIKEARSHFATKPNVQHVKIQSQGRLVLLGDLHGPV